MIPLGAIAGVVSGARSWLIVGAAAVALAAAGYILILRADNAALKARAELAAQQRDAALALAEQNAETARHLTADYARAMATVTAEAAAARARAETLGSLRSEIRRVAEANPASCPPPASILRALDGLRDPGG